MDTFTKRLVLAVSLMVLLVLAERVLLLGTSFLALVLCSVALVALACMVLLRRGVFRERAEGRMVARAAPVIRGALLLTACVCVCAAVFRGVPVFVSLFCAAACLVVCFRIPPPPMAESSPLLNGLLLAVSVCICVAMAEVAARLVFPVLTESGDFYAPDEAYLFLPRPGGVMTRKIPLLQGGEKIVEHRVSSQGFRDVEHGVKEPGEFRVLMLGDSFLEGFAVAPEDSIPKIAETLLRADGPLRKISVVNGGVPGGGPLQALGMLRLRGLPLEPNLVVLCLYTGNDFANSLEAAGKRFRAFDMEWHRRLLKWRAQSSLPCRIERALQKHFRLYSLTSSATGRDLVMEFSCNFRFFRTPVPPRPGQPEDRTPLVEMDLREWYPELDLACVLLEGEILEMREECGKRGIGFAVCCVEDAIEMDGNEWLKHTARAPGGAAAYERHKALRVAEEFLRREGISHFPVMEDIRALDNVLDAYYRFDGHFSELGNRLVARRIADYVREKYLGGR